LYQKTQQMENTKMKTITNLFLVLTLTASMALADGHTGGGGRCDTCTPPPCTENCGGFAEEEGETTPLGESEEGSEESFTEYFTEIFFDLFG
jgi:hypothetical protein